MKTKIINFSKRFLRWADKGTVPIAFVLCFFISMQVYLRYFGGWKGMGNAFKHDIYDYYMYLPAVFIHHDVTYNWYGAPNTPKGYILNKVTYGIALFYLPFFLTAHLISNLWRLGTTGFEPMYGFFLLVSSAFYTSLGIYYLKKYLKIFFPLPVVLLALLGVLGGTNLYFYASVEGGMSHCYSFFLLCVFIYMTPKFVESPNLKNTMLLGIPLALEILIRPINIIILLFPLLYDVYSWREFRNRLHFLFIKNLKWIFLWVVIGFIFALPQMLYWHLLTNKYIVFSYQGESFIYWKNPKILQVWFGAKKGLFLYTPILLVSVLGLFYSWKEKKYQFHSVTLIFLIVTYLFASWWSWWFGGSFGHRAFVEFYAFLSIPLAESLYQFNQKKKYIAIILNLLVLFLIYVNVRFMYFYIEGKIHWDSMDWEQYWSVVKKLI